MTLILQKHIDNCLKISLFENNKYMFLVFEVSTHTTFRFNKTCHITFLLLWLLRLLDYKIEDSAVEEDEEGNAAAELIFIRPDIRENMAV